MRKINRKVEQNIAEKHNFSSDMNKSNGYDKEKLFYAQVSLNSYLAAFSNVVDSVNRRATRLLKRCQSINDLLMFVILKSSRFTEPLFYFRKW